MPSETSDAPRQIGKYDLLAKVAEGGMGAVYKARHQETGQVVAIKIVPSDAARTPLLLRRFEQEFKAASLIDHPNVVKAIDYCGTGPSPFLVMEFVEGETLGQKVDREGPLPEDEAVWLIGQVCDGLHRAHKQGLIHRDVKPDNVMVTPDGVAKLMDLGLVKDVEAELNLTRTGRGLGTPHFMAPEQFRNAKNADVRCDVYSLGATLYMIVTGTIPFAKTTPLECWMKKVKGDFPDPKELAPHVSAQVNRAICRAMSPKPEKRPASCREFMEDLTGAGWRANGGASSSGTGTAATVRRFPTDDLWYMVYRAPDGELHTVKGSTDSIRRNVSGGSLGDTGSILVSRSKTGQFLSLKSVPEFRDLAAGPGSGGVKPAGSASSPRLSSTSFDPPELSERTKSSLRVNADEAARSAEGTAENDDAPTPPSTPAPARATVADITDFEHMPLDPDAADPAPRKYTVPAPPQPPPAPRGGLQWPPLYVLIPVAVLAIAAGLTLAILLK
jgi:serine/threonine protein kinase